MPQEDLTLVNSEQSSKRSGTVYPSKPDPTGRNASAGRLRTARAFLLKNPPKETVSFKKVNEERDRRFKEFSKEVQRQLPVAQKKGSGSGKSKPDGYRTPACHCDISPRDSAKALPLSPLPRSIRAVFFKRGVMIKGKPAPLNAGGGKRGSVTEFSTRSRIRCGWAFLNAETDWLAMVTLTYPEMPDVEACRGHLRNWLKRVERDFPGQMDVGWCIEATKEGRPHFHVFFGSGGTMGKAISREKTTSITRKGKQYRVMRGKVERVCVESWIGILEGSGLSYDRDACERFQWGGICERLNSPDAAARYVSKEASKRAQKGQSLGKGCFWRLSRHLKGKPRWMSSVSAKGRNVLPCYSRVFDIEAVRQLVDCKEFDQFNDGETEEAIEEAIKAKKKSKIEEVKAWRKSQVFSYTDSLDDVCQ